MNVSNVRVESVCIVSKDVVVRTIADDMIIVPLVAGIGDAGDELYTVNEFGQIILRELNGVDSIGEIANKLAQEFDAGKEDICEDVLGFVSEMIKMGIVVLTK